MVFGHQSPFLNSCACVCVCVCVCVYVCVQVIDSSDVVVQVRTWLVQCFLMSILCVVFFVWQVLDARDPQGTRSAHIEKFLKREKPHKHLVFLLNKCDLVPTWVTVSDSCCAALSIDIILWCLI